MLNWDEVQFDHRAKVGGEEGADGKTYKTGEFMPFYVPRPFMPQIDEADYDELFAFATEKGVEIAKIEVSPADVRPHQHVDIDKARKMDEGCLVKPILVSLEPFILDGHHRWYEHKVLERPLTAFQVRLGFKESIEFLFSFPKTYAYGDGQQHKVEF